MTFIVWTIVGGVNEQNSNVNTVCAANWTAESAIKATKDGWDIDRFKLEMKTRHWKHRWPSYIVSHNPVLFLHRVKDHDTQYLHSSGFILHNCTFKLALNTTKSTSRPREHQSYFSKPLCGLTLQNEISENENRSRVRRTVLRLFSSTLIWGNSIVNGFTVNII